MTDGSAASCASCATPLRAGTAVCPRCASVVAPPLADLPVLLDGCVPAGTGARTGARVLDGLVVAVPVLLGAAAVLLVPAARPAAVVAGAVVSVLVAAGLVAAYGRTGRTPGLAATGCRAVDVVTGLVPRTAGGPARWRGDVVVLDVRTGRDPVTTPAPRGAVSVPLQGPASATSGYRAEPAPSPTHAAPAASPTSHARTLHHQPPDHGRVATQPAARSTEASAAAGPAPVVTGPPGSAQPRHAATTTVPEPTAAPSPPRSTGVRVRLDDGRSVVVGGVTLVGRNPAPAPGDPHAELLPLPDLTRSVSKTHAVLRWDGRDLRVTDRRSTNGTLVESAGERYQLPAGVETVAPVGSRILLGDHVLTVEGIVT